MKEFWTRHPEAETCLRRWLGLVRKANWTRISELRNSFPQADMAEVRSGNKVFVFNVGGNNFRIVAAIHFNTGRVYVLRILNHHDYKDGYWKQEL